MFQLLNIKANWLFTSNILSKKLLIILCTIWLAACGGGSGGSEEPSKQASDRDNDGVVDTQDHFPDDPNEHTDSDGDGVGDNSDAFPNDANRHEADLEAPVLAEAQPIGEVKTYTPLYSFTSTEAGRIEYSGDCTSETVIAVEGSNSVTFDNLVEGYYENCKVAVTDATGNKSEPLSVSAFTILDSTPPSLSNPSHIEVGDSFSVNFSFESDEDGALKATGECSTEETSTVIGTNTLTLIVDKYGTFSNCTITVLDDADNISDGLIVPEFTVVPRYISVTSWKGESDNLIEFSEKAKGFKYERSTNWECDFETLENCDNYLSTIIDDKPIVGTGNYSNPGDLSSHIIRTGNISSSKTKLINKFSMSSEPIISNTFDYSAVVYKDKLWVAYGEYKKKSDHEYSKGLWSSHDGQNWTTYLQRYSYERSSSTITVFDGKLWAVQGHDREDYSGNREYAHNVVSSENGSDWRWIDQGPFPPRSEHLAVTFKDKLWVYGGSDHRLGVQDNDLTDVWSMDKEGDWTKHQDNGSYPKKPYAVLEFKDSLWMFTNRGIWKSSNGINWTEQTDVQNYSVSNGAEPHWVVFDNALWSIGSVIQRRDLEEYRGTVMKSTDGINWEYVTKIEAIGGSKLEKFIAYKDKLILLGVGPDGYTMVSEDGINWRRGYSGQFKFPQIVPK